MFLISTDRLFCWQDDTHERRQDSYDATFALAL